MPKKDTLFFGPSRLAYVSRFGYLGITVPSDGHSFAAHLRGRCRKALVAVSSISKPQLLSLHTAMQLFDIKIAPIATYGIELF